MSSARATDSISVFLPTTTATLLNSTSFVLGNAVKDTITINTTALGTLPVPTGNWGLNVSTNSGMTGATTIGSGPLSGSLPFTTSVTWTPSAAGTYYFQAFYSGDGNYSDSHSTPTDEALVVTSPALVTRTWGARALNLNTEKGESVVIVLQLVTNA